MNQSSIPGPTPPRPSEQKISSSDKESASERVDVNELLTRTASSDNQQKLNTPQDRLSNILNRPTSEIVDETVSVASFAVDNSKTVGGLGITILTIAAFIATSPWSWIASLVFGPVRVWTFFHNAAIGGIGAFFGSLIILLMLLVLIGIILIFWLIFRTTN